MNNCHNEAAIASKKSLPPQKKLKESEIIDDLREEVEDGRRVSFSIIDNIFIEAGFDSHTVSVYLRIIWRAANNNNGFFESIKTTAEKLGICERQLHYCRGLLEFCNIIKIKKRYDPKNNNRQISSLITVTDKSTWNLDHEWRNARIFGKRNEKSSGLHIVQGEGAHSAGGRVHIVQREQDLLKNKITNEQDHLIGGGEKKSTASSGLKHGYASTLFADMLALVFYANRKYKRFPNKEADEIMSGIMEQTGINKKEAIEILEEIVDKQIPYSLISPTGKRDKKVIEDDFVRFIKVERGDINEI